MNRLLLCRRTMVFAFCALSVSGALKQIDVYKDTTSQADYSINQTQKEMLIASPKGAKKSVSALSNANMTPELLAPVGRGVDAAACGCFAYESKAIYYDVLERNWLNSIYSQSNCEVADSMTIATGFSGYNAQEACESYNIELVENCAVGISLPYMEMGLAGKVGYSASMSVRRKESNFIYNEKMIRREFNYSLPDFDENKDTYLQHISVGFLDLLKECEDSLTNRFINGQLYVANPWLAKLTIRGLFEKYGTHVLMGASYGGACDILYTAHSNSSECELAKVVTEDVKGDLKAEIDASFSGDANASFDIRSALSGSTASVTQKFQMECHGGSFDEFPSSNLGGIAGQMSKWVKTVPGKPGILQYIKAEPIWSFVPSQYSKAASLMKEFFPTYLSEKGTSYRNSTITSVLGGNTLNDSVVVLDESTTNTFGDYWDQRRNKDYYIRLDPDSFYNPDTLAFAGFKNVKIEPSFELHEQHRGTKVGILIEYGGGKKSQTPEDYDLENNKWISCSLSTLGMSPIQMTIADFMAYPKMHFRFATNNRAPSFLHWEERGAEIRNFKVKITYTK